MGLGTPEAVEGMIKVVTLVVPSRNPAEPLGTGCFNVGLLNITLLMRKEGPMGEVDWSQSPRDPEHTA